MKKRIIMAVLVMLMAVLMITPAFAIVEPTAEFYVADYANVLSDDTEQEIIEANGVLENTCNGAQIVVVAVEYLDGMYSDEYALQVMNDWGVGDGNENNGMVLVFATMENKGWLMTGDGIDAYFTDNMADEYMNDYFWDSFDKGQYDKAVQKLFPELVEWYEDYYDANMSGGNPSYYYPEPEPLIDFGFIFYIIIFIAMIVLIAMLNSRRRFRSYYVHMGMPVPRFHFWYMWRGPHRHWHAPPPPHHHHAPRPPHHSGPRGPHGPSGFGGHGGSSRSSFGGGAGRGGRSSFGGMGRGGGGRSGGGGGGRR